ncbi:MAG TPA: 2,3,4,5-tetrahydropyridine-2,6-dicarboxylate N-succinyltransferase [Candidatus Polarisedimenticolaceae bacterium]|nr:2,3,4,5-tetrahydropyridine-2,6-dicarboxylate N-succinyltransferase [Candidatus Polarisedimenticolaceae bacterium]
MSLGLRGEIESLIEAERLDTAAARAVIERLFDALEEGRVRAASPGDGSWVVNPWVKQGILLAFRIGRNVRSGAADGLVFHDRDTLPLWRPRDGSEVRVVPGGSSVRRGAHVADGVVIMPPSYVNVGAFVGAGSLIDSHVLVGSCAQVGRDVHLSAAVQLGGVLEPIGTLPVIVEDGAFLGGGCGIYEGVRIGRRAVLAPGVVLSRAVALYDLPRRAVHRAGEDGSLVVPDGAVVVPGARPATGEFAAEHGLKLHAPVIVKYRDARTDAALALEGALR